MMWKLISECFEGTMGLRHHCSSGIIKFELYKGLCICGQLSYGMLDVLLLNVISFICDSCPRYFQISQLYTFLHSKLSGGI